ncbi:alpha/beta fold hydrolase [Brevibacterium album]|uniref:alpha/beta fold hydrolase n=1 Tax=Brevibacterium album TaxID=417948 RepID=UPI000404C44B|nr:alpha/beta hydrolase [Brevibacterium album]
MEEDSIILVPGTEVRAEAAFAGLKPLLERDHRVILFDYRSSPGGDAARRMQDYLEQLEDLIGQRSAQGRVHLFGYSLGAHIALRYAADHRARVSTLALAGGWLRTDQLQQSRHELWLELYAREPALAGRLSHMLQYSPKYRRHLAEQQTASQLAPAVPDEETRRRVEVNLALDSSEPASRVETPTLLISGTADAKVPLEGAHELFGAIAPAVFVPVDSGHALLRERLGEVYGAYADFLRGRCSPGEHVRTFLP